RKRQDVLHPIDSVTLIVTAHNDRIGFIQPESIIAHDIEEIAQFLPLHNMPIDDIYFLKKGIAFSYENITIKVKEIISKGKPLPLSSTIIYFNPTHADLLNGTFRNKWGEIWNIDLYVDAKVNLMHTIMDSLCGIEFFFPGLNKSIWGKIRRVTCQ